MSSFRTRLVFIENPEDAYRELSAVGVDTGGLGMMATKMQTRCIKLFELSCRQANILKQEMLSLGGDAAVARGTVACSIPKTDVLLIGTDKQLHKLCCKLPLQPFGLAGLGAELQSLLADLHVSPKQWKTSQRSLTLDRPLIMGILNVTPDSFSDGNHFYNPHNAIEHGIRLAAEGADIIDIGGESTRPGAAPVSLTEEIRRILPVVTALRDAVTCAISIDTWKSGVAAAALDAGAEIINDISGFTFDPEMATVAADSGAGAVVMHTRGTPQTMQQNTVYHDLLGEVRSSLQDCIDTALAAGVQREQLVIDPGIGFAKQSQHNLQILKQLQEFKCFGLPILVGSSRKSFIGATLNRQADDRLFGTAATVALATANGAHILRVHDVRAMRDVADMSYAISHCP